MSSPHALAAFRLPAGLALRLRKAGQAVELAIDGARVTERDPKGGARRAFEQTYAQARVAEIVFEQRLARLRAAGYAPEVRAPCPLAEAGSPTLASALALADAAEQKGDGSGTLLRAGVERIAHGDEGARALEQALLAAERPPGSAPFPRFDEPLTCLERGGRLFAWCFDDDEATVEDELRPELARVGASALGFAPDDPRVSLDVVALHRLRRLLASKEADRIASLRLMTFGPLAPFLALLREHGRLDLLTSVVVRGEPAALEATAAHLEGLCAREDALPVALTAPREALRHLVLLRGAGDLAAALARVEAARVPAVTHLGLWSREVTPEGLRALAAHPILAQLDVLDLWSPQSMARFPFDELLALRASFGGLTRLLLGAHLVPDRVRRRLADWPAVEWIEHDRREALALDVLATGWRAATR